MKNLTDVMAELPPERRARVEARAEALIAEETTLRDLRRARELTQERMAELPGVGQDNISRLKPGRTCSCPPYAAMLPPWAGPSTS
jgi:hypothetical protein